MNELESTVIERLAFGEEASSGSASGCKGGSRLGPDSANEIEKTLIFSKEEIDTNY